MKVYKLLALMLVVSFVFIACSCEYNDPLKTETGDTTEAAVNKEITENTYETISISGIVPFIPSGNYVYVQNGPLRVFNMNTESLSSVCTDPLCPGGDDCPLANVYNLCYIDGDILYAFCIGLLDPLNDDENSYYLMSYNTKTYEVKYLKFFEKYEVKNSGLIPHDGYFYYEYKALKDGGDPENSADYLPALGRMNMKTAECEFYCFTDPTGNSQISMITAGGKMIFLEKQSDNFFYYSTDMNYENKTYINSLPFCTYSYLQGENFYNMNDEDGETILNNNLYKTDLDKNEKKLIAEDILTFTVTDQYVYVASETEEDGSQIICLDFDGNVVKNYTIDMEYKFGRGFRVYGNTAFCEFDDYSNGNTKGQSYYGYINLNDLKVNLF